MFTSITMMFFISAQTCGPIVFRVDTETAAKPFLKSESSSFLLIYAKLM